MRNQRFTFLCTKEERLILERLAFSCKRSRGDTIRQLIHEAMQKMLADAEKTSSLTEKASQKEEVSERP